MKIYDGMVLPEPIHEWRVMFDATSGNVMILIDSNNIVDCIQITPVQLKNLRNALLDVEKFHRTLDVAEKLCNLPNSRIK